jgi:hypothetical protein
MRARWRNIPLVSRPLDEKIGVLVDVADDVELSQSSKSRGYLDLQRIMLLKVSHDLVESMQDVQMV